MKEKELIVTCEYNKEPQDTKKIIQQSFLIYIQRELKDNAHNLALKSACHV